jgi:rare lipoprotein A (peptidoglycan hydrolase)
MIDESLADRERIVPATPTSHHGHCPSPALPRLGSAASRVIVKIARTCADAYPVTAPHRLRLALAVALATGLCGPFAAATATGAPAAITQADLDRLDAKVRSLTATAERAQEAVLAAAASATQLRLDLDRLADQRDAQQQQVDAALVALYEQSDSETSAPSGPRFDEINPALARVYGAGVTGQASAVDTLDAHAATLSKMSAEAQRYHDLLAGQAKTVYAAEDEALTLLATERAQYERLQQAAQLARIDAQAQHLRAISDRVSTTATPGLGRRGAIALDQQAGVLQLLLAAGSGYPKGYAPTGQTFDGTSSWYGPGFEGKATASGAPFDPEKLTAAMKAVPLGTVIHVTHGGHAVNLLVNDRGPYVGDRMIDCSRAGSRQLGFDGLADVHIEVLAPAG